ncbi:hypothetical protein DD235_12415 [Corticimicrobacter populi]|uniref:Polysaccharide biosynthesis protein C-terminal domain-containing protein n=2 Tax=Corticimicrobacter populi TaxID=2175229 RepID=A0A2V1K0L5_9BURK|nr:hypothetical protein DD235_12415 [Corticimicrobacter populi]
MRGVLHVLTVVLPQVLPAATNFVFLMLLANKLNVDLFGRYSYVLALIAFPIAFSDLGLKDFFLGRKAGLHREGDVQSLFLFSAIVFFPVAICVGMASGSGIEIFLIVLPEVFALSVIYKSIVFFYQRQDRLVVFSRIDFCIKIVAGFSRVAIFFVTDSFFYSIGIASLFVFASYSFWMLRVADLAGAMAGFFGKIIAVFRLWRGWLPFFMSFLSFYLYSLSDRVIVMKYLGEEALARYATSYNIIAVGQLLVGAIWSLYMPRFARGAGIFDTARFFWGMVLLGVLVLAGSQFFGYFAFEYLYNERYRDSFIILGVSSFYFLFRFPNVVVEMFYVRVEAYGKYVSFRVLVAVFSILANICFAERFGLLGVCVVFVISELVLFCLSFPGFFKNVPLTQGLRQSSRPER